LAILMRQLGHFPVMMEMRLQKRSNPNFPNEKVYERFGARAQLASRVIVHRRSQPEFEDVMRITLRHCLSIRITSALMSKETVRFDCRPL
jgi:hypothetical protein